MSYNINEQTETKLTLAYSRVTFKIQSNLWQPFHNNNSNMFFVIKFHLFLEGWSIFLYLINYAGKQGKHLNRSQRKFCYVKNNALSKSTNSWKKICYFSAICLEKKKTKIKIKKKWTNAKPLGQCTFVSILWSEFFLKEHWIKL